jgi:hypothetical protein
MNRIFAVACLLGIAACKDDRTAFGGPSGSFENDGGVDAAACLRQCSLDGRSVVDACTGAVLEACPANLACGAAVCQEPCAAATADRSSNGCEFYMQPPEFAALAGRGCYAAFVVNGSTQPAELRERDPRGSVPELVQLPRRSDLRRDVARHHPSEDARRVQGRLARVRRQRQRLAAGRHEWARVDLARNGGPGESFGTSVCQKGLQRMKSEGPFTATLWGWSQYASYAYPGGLALRKLVPSSLGPIR